MSAAILNRVLSEARNDPATYRAFVLLPDRERYTTLADIERHLSRDPEAMAVLLPHLQANHRGAWNLLLLGFARLLSRWVRFAEVDVLFVLLVEGVRKEVPLAPHVYWGIANHQRGELRDQARLSAYAHDQPEADRTPAQSSDGPILAVVPSVPDPLLSKQIKGVLQEMPPARQQALLLRGDGHRVPEIAQEVGASCAAIKQHLTRGRSALASLR